MVIDKRELIFIINTLLSNLDSQADVIVEEDFYWDISTTEIYQPYETPKDLTLGQISDDWQELQRLLIQDGRCAVGYDFKRLATILRVISHNYP